jgi:hypothetical protein
VKLWAACEFAKRFLAVLLAAFALFPAIGPALQQSIEQLAVRAEQFERGRGRWEMLKSTSVEILKIDPRSVWHPNGGCSGVHPQAVLAGSGYRKRGFEILPEFSPTKNLNLKHCSPYGEMRWVRRRRRLSETFRARRLLAGALVGQMIFRAQFPRRRRLS